ncbi:MAG: hypothetical protein JWO89_1620 [Verrucomicrobiaceae bacterium]|nr:hypothetical protein [Verrucomicrobiaceae bacterium]
MSEEQAQSSSLVSIFVDALTFPLRRIGWWLFVTACAIAAMWLLGNGYINKGIIYCTGVLLAVTVRSYLTIVENTLTGYGEDIGQSSGLRAEGMWADLGNLALVSLCSWAPAILAVFMVSPFESWKEPLVTLLASLGCEYFCMAVMGTVVFGGIQGALPQHVLPAIFKSGSSYALAGVILMLVPLSFRTGYSMFVSYGIGAWAGAAIFSAFIVVMQARLVGLIYLANKERIGWE